MKTQPLPRATRPDVFRAGALDFTVWVGNLFCIGEARWLQEPVDTKQVRDFFGKLVDRPPFVIGVIISTSGFTAPALEWMKTHTSDRTILPADEQALDSILSEAHSFSGFVIHQLEERLKHPRD